MATITITTTAAQDARIAPAIGSLLGLTTPGTNTPRNATGAEVKQWLVDDLREATLRYERRVARDAVAEPAPLTPTVT